MVAKVVKKSLRLMELQSCIISIKAYRSLGYSCPTHPLKRAHKDSFNPLALELDIYCLAYHLYKM
jgi:hypothetical protein